MSLLKPSKQLVDILNSRARRDFWLEAHADALHLWGTIGEDWLLTLDGRMLRWIWDGVDDRNGTLQEVTHDPEKFTAIRIGARKVPELRSLLPDSTGLKPCPDCSPIVDGHGFFIVCAICGGVGSR
jgi:hypothetical protein